MLALGLGLSGLGVLDALEAENTTVEGGVMVVTDNVEGSPPGYFGFGVPLVVGSRFRRRKKVAGSRARDER